MTLSDISSASFSVNVDLETIRNAFCNALSRESFSDASVCTSFDQFTQENRFISALILSGMVKVTDDIYSSPRFTICSNLCNCLTLRMMILLNTSAQFTSGYSDIFFLSSDGMDNVTVAMLFSLHNSVNIHNYVDVFNSFVTSHHSLTPVTTVYD